jgi:hypothetical protein
MLKQVMWIAAAAAVLGVCGVGFAEEKGSKGKSKVRKGKLDKPVPVEQMLSKSTLASLTAKSRDIEVGGSASKGISDEDDLAAALNGLGVEPEKVTEGTGYLVTVDGVGMYVDYLPDLRMVRVYIPTYPLKNASNTPSSKLLGLLEVNSSFGTWVYRAESEDFLAFALVEGKATTASVLRSRLEGVANLWSASMPQLDILDWPAE